MVRILSIATALSLWFIATTMLQAGADTIRKGDVVIEAPWARASIGTTRPAAAYLSIRNEGGEPVILTGVSTPASAVAEVHKITMSDGIARMEPAGEVVVPAGSEVVMKPGGLHIMMMKLKQPLKNGESLSMTLIFNEIGSVDILLPILGVGASGPIN